MRTRRRTNILLGLAVLIVALVVAAQAFGVIPAPIFDVIARAAPVLLVMAGLVMLLRGRVPLGGLIAIVLSLALTGGIAAYSFSSRAEQVRDDYQQAIAQPVPADLALLRVRVATTTTDVELLRAVGTGTGITGQFAGSTESQIVLDYVEADDGSATMTVREERPNALPMLEALGRGTLRLELPPDIPLDVELVGTAGAVTINMADTRLERMNLDLAQGDALVTLPAYAPAYTEVGESLGTLATRDGDITIFVPSAVAARLELDRGGSGIEPEYDPTIYNFLFNTMLEARAIELSEIILQYNVVAPRGRIRLEVSDTPPA